MGRDKLALEVGGVPLVHRVRDALALQCEEILAAGAVGSLPDSSIRRVPDLRPGREGPLAGMEAGFADARYRLLFVAAGDMPFIPAELVALQLERLSAGGAPAVVPRYADRLHPLCAAYDRKILPGLSSMLDAGMRAVWRFLETLEGVEYVERDLLQFGDPEVFLMNVNSPRDLVRAEALAGGSGR